MVTQGEREAERQSASSRKILLDSGFSELKQNELSLSFSAIPIQLCVSLFINVEVPNKKLTSIRPTWMP
jgi:hypothetical protein